MYEKVIWFQNSLWFMRKHFGSAHGVEGFRSGIWGLGIEISNFGVKRREEIALV